MAENQNINQKLEQLTSENTEFKREVSLFSGVNVLAGIMVGSGIFYLGSYVLIRSGMSMGLALIVWVIAGLISLLSGLCYAELGTMMPKSGGAYIYLREAYGERIAFMNGFPGRLLHLLLRFHRRPGCGVSQCPQRLLPHDRVAAESPWRFPHRPLDPV